MAGLRVNIEGWRFRASDGKLGADAQLRIVRQRLSGLAASSLRAGDSPAASAEIISQRQPVALEISEVGIDSVAEVSAAAVSQTSKIDIPEMIDINDKVKIMKGELTVGLFKRVMEGYEITGHNDDELRAILADPAQESNALTYVSLLNAREVAKRLSNLTGRKFRVQTEDEWMVAKDNLSGNHWTWTETKFSGATYVLRLLDGGLRDFRLPEGRCGAYAVRLVEDK
ncbi:hypothetical protein A3H38_05990 [candidate division WOR-1 bacterium RIFCSPLOWO2_02_FULL_46_20]|uniref:Sulfatase-modifying factor enzyme domain-containing protein n=1 Tax=candidate division WOR-1 bacterium RIFCSPLOWO2_02_FULL_46_20 TaxID=1802567 RepID=A0A1F4RBG6_UNCSA|nr:MAG: hypothetical protein A3H38_05990 [candidate division WOR-1 bacterium RIFCSPLOWO2_02_FULL_46_20]